MHKDLSRSATAVLTLLLAAGSLFAQNKPNFTGTWVSSTSQILTIVQDESRLTVREIFPSLERTLTYQLDGSESQNETKTVLGETWKHLSKIMWVSKALVITTRTTRETGSSWDSMKIYTLDSQGTLSVTTVDAVAMMGPYMFVGTVTFTRQQSSYQHNIEQTVPCACDNQSLLVETTLTVERDS
jgi:hypothetical protein